MNNAKLPLKDKKSNELLIKNGFVNVDGCSAKSHWSLKEVKLSLSLDLKIHTLPQLFKVIYEQGKESGTHSGEKKMIRKMDQMF